MMFKQDLGQYGQLQIALIIKTEIPVLWPRQSFSSTSQLKWWDNGAVANLNLSIVTSLKCQCKQGGRVEEIFDRIEGLYEDNTSTITEIGNKELNRLLKNLASLLSSVIAN